MLLFYDCEVFRYNWLFVIINSETHEKTIIFDDSDMIKEFYDKHKDHIWVGYNSRHYDQYILKSIICGFNPYEVSRHIISGAQGWEYSNLFQKIQLYNFDIMTSMHGLKELEGFMGNDIRESSVSFDIDRALTETELEDAIAYCTHDVEQTIEVFLQRREEFDSQIALLKAFDLPLKFISKTKAQLAAIILKAHKQDRNDEFNIVLPNTLEISQYRHIVDWYNENRDYEKYLEIVVSGIPHVFAWGGLHGAIDNYKGEGFFISIDVSSYYPSLMIEYGFLSRNVEDPEVYKQIYYERLRLKSLKDPMQQPYKIVLNATYGAMKHKFNNLYDPLQANNVCVGGQLLLLDLIEKLEPYWKLIQSNTDGLIGKVKHSSDFEKIESVCLEWEQRTLMKLEFDTFKRIFQKDVNNYIIVHEDGSYKSKGAYVKKLNDIDNDLPIVNKALVEYFIKDIPVEDTINNCREIIMFQKVVKISSKYSHALHGNKRLREKCLRVFASKDIQDPSIYKVKESKGKAEKIANTPEHCFIFNDAVLGKRISRKLDREWYITLALSRVEDFIGE